MKPRIGSLHVITDTTIQDRHTPAELAEQAIAGGADTIQYRSKSPDIRTLIAEAAAVRSVCSRHGVTFIVNDRVDLCQAVDADGVHLGRDDMPLAIARKVLGGDKIIGATVRCLDHLREAESEGADYVGLGPVFPTTSKSLPIDPLGPEVVRAVTSAARIPVIAIAGITMENVMKVIDAGVGGIAVISAVCGALDVTAATAAFRALIKR